MAKKEVSATDERTTLMKAEFLALELKHNEWFDEKDTFIEDYFIDANFANDFVAGCALPDYIKIECALIKSKFALK